MKKHLAVAMALVLAVALISPFSVSAKTKAGTKPGSFFYFFDKAFEKADLFFTFNPEKKAKKALENAEERLAEAEESASENNQEAVAEAMKDYQENISLAETEAKLIKDETKTKELLSTIASSTSKHQEVLEKVLTKVPEEAIQKAIEVSRKGGEESEKKITEPEKEVSEIKQEIKERKNEPENNKDEQKKEVEKLKKEVEMLKQKQPQVKIIEKIIEKEKTIVIEKKESSSSQIKQNENIITLPSGAVVEMNDGGDIIKTIKEAPTKSILQTTSSIQNTPIPTNEAGVTFPVSSSSQSSEINITNKHIPTEISVQNQVCNLSQTNLKTEYQLYDLLQNGNIDGRIFMNAYILENIGQNYYTSNPSAKMTITTSNHSNDKTINGSGNTGPCGYHYFYEFYATQTGTYTITYSVPEFNLSKIVTLNIIGAEKPVIGSSGVTISTSQKETDYPLSELANLDSTSNVKYWFQTSKPNYRYSISAWCSDADTPFSKIDVVSHLEKDGLDYYRGYFRSADKFSGITACKFIHSADTPMTISSKSDTVTFDVK